MPKYFTENYPEVEAGFSLKISDILFSQKSDYQKIEVVESPHFGKVLLIDDCIMLTERDEFIYHEMIAHVPLFVHARPANILVIGGGDGGAVREILRHPEVEHIQLVDIDRMVSEVSLRYFPAVSAGLLSSKVTCSYMDGVAFVTNERDRQYDLIIIDSTDPVNVGEGLFTAGFYASCYRILKDDGILINQAESPIFTGKWLRQIVQKLSGIFPRLHFYHASIPTYPSGYWLFGYASKQYHPQENFREDKFKQLNLLLKYYNREIHQAAFVLPNYVRKIIDD